MIPALSLLFLCQLAGEVVVRALGLPFPGPVLGMGLLFAGLLVRGRSDPALDAVADTILRHLSLLFVPAAVGVDAAGGPDRRQLAGDLGRARRSRPLLTLVVTVYVFRAVARLTAARA